MSIIEYPLQRANAEFTWSGSNQHDNHLDWLRWQFQPGNCGLVSSVWLSAPQTLDDHHELLRSMFLLLFRDPDEWVVSDPQFHIHGVGDSPGEAVTDFVTALLGTIDLLSSQEALLSRELLTQLRELQSYFIPTPYQ